jgi:hypothetical protein
VTEESTSVTKEAASTPAKAPQVTELTITSLSFDKEVYNPGEPVTLTVKYVTPNSNSLQFGEHAAQVTTSVTDSLGTATKSASFTVDSGAAQSLPISVVASDDKPPPGGTWVMVSNTLTGTGPWDGIAVLTSYA